MFFNMSEKTAVMFVFGKWISIIIPPFSPIGEQVMNRSKRFHLLVSLTYIKISIIMCNIERS
jgi:hypothetical protein